jgi:putative endonuclease
VRERTFFVYILANRPGGVLYTGVTNDLKRRVFQHKSGEGGGFTKRYSVHLLVYFELYNEPFDHQREVDQSRPRRKVELIEGFNPS